MNREGMAAPKQPDLTVVGDGASKPERKLGPVEEIRQTVRFTLPPFARVAVVTGGRQALLTLEGRITWPLPRDRSGAYSGPYPRNDGDALAQVEAVRSEGAEFLLIPKWCLWWLDYYEGLRRHLASSYRVAFRDESCLIIALHKEIDPTAEDGAPDGLPLPSPELMAMTTDSYWSRSFLETGQATSETIKRILSANDLDIGSFENVLDFGCGSGRIMRYWKDVSGPSFFGVDYNPYLVEWCRNNLRFGDFRRVFPDEQIPHSDEAFDFIYSYSVFTHLDLSSQQFWMRELQRVLRPGGFLYLTLRGERYAEVLSSEERRRFDAGEMVVKAERVSGSNACLAHHPEAFVRDQLAPGMTVVDIVPSDGVDQQADEYLDVVIYRKP
jgi:SAM-dependent methyltransferase